MSSITTYQGRRCTKVRRQAGTAAPVSNITSTSSSTTSTSTTSSTSTSTPIPPNNGPATTPLPNIIAPQQPDTNTSPTTSTSTTTPAVRPPAQRPPADRQPPPPAGGNQPAATTPVLNPAPQAPQAPQNPSASTSTTGDGGVIVPLPLFSTNNPNPQPAPSPQTPANDGPAQVSAPNPNREGPVPTAPAGGGQQPESGGESGGSGGGSNPPSNPQEGESNQPAVSVAPVVAGPGTGSTTTAGVIQPTLDPVQSQIAQPILAQPLLSPAPTVRESAAPIRASPSTSTTIFVSTGSDGEIVSRTSSVVVTPTASHDPSKGHSGSGGGHSEGAEGGLESGHSGDGHMSGSSRPSAGAVAGTVIGVLCAIAVIAILFVCFRRARKRRNRNSGTPLLSRNLGLPAKETLLEKFGAIFARKSASDGSSTKSGMSEKFTEFFAPKHASSEKEPEYPRMPTPSIERGVPDNASSFYTTNTRTRSSSVPVSAFRDRAMNIMRGLSRRGQQESDNVPDLPVVATRNVPPRIPTPISHRRSASSVSSLIQTWSATDDNNNPFRDPESNGPSKPANAALSRTNTTKTITELPPILQPKRSPLMDVPNSPARRSSGALQTNMAFVPEVAMPQRPRHKRSFSNQKIINPFMNPQPGLAIGSPSHQQHPSAEVDGLAYRRHSRNLTYSGRPLQHQPSKSSVDSGFVSAKSPLVAQKEDEGTARPDSDPLKQWNLSGVLGSKGGSSYRSSESTNESPFGDANRISKLSFWSGEQLGSSPGPTRPVTAAYPSYILDRQSRVSDPFDLDRPEVLSMMKQHWMITSRSRDTSASRSSSPMSRRSRATTTTPVNGRKNSEAISDFLNNDDIGRGL